MKKHFSCFFLLFFLISCGSDTSKKNNSNLNTPIDIKNLASTYKMLKRVTDKPVYIDPQLAMLCIGASEEDVKNAQKTKGPHAMGIVYIYMNDLASTAFENESYSYPVGSIIIKDKNISSYRTSNGSVKPKDGVGGMIKRESTYDPKNGNWEYFYFETPDSIESGKIKSCVECHSNTSKTDYVYGGWSKRDK